MTYGSDDISPSRRRFLGAGVGAAAAAASAATSVVAARPVEAAAADIEPFYGRFQAGIITPPQTHVCFAAFDLVSDRRDDVEGLLKGWTAAAALMVQGLPPADAPAPDSVPVDSSEALGLDPARLTVTFGFGAGLFSKDGVDRYGLAARRPEALIDLPRFNGDQLVPERTGGDLCVQACANNPQVAFHAVRHLARMGDGLVKLRWMQDGFSAGGGAGTPRNLMGFKDGTMNPDTQDRDAMARLVWAGDEGGWMKGGSYLVARPIRIALEHWDRMKLSFQEQVVGRKKDSGAPLGGSGEFAPLDLKATDANGNFVVPEASHVRLGAPEMNDGAQILRRAYSYNNGLSFVAERWPPWRQGLEFDAGLLFLAWQRDPRTGFVKIFENMSKFDMMNQFVTHIGGGLFACPPGVPAGGYIGQGLFEA